MWPWIHSFILSKISQLKFSFLMSNWIGSSFTNKNLIMILSTTALKEVRKECILRQAYLYSTCAFRMRQAHPNGPYKKCFTSSSIQVTMRSRIQSMKVHFLLPSKTIALSQLTLLIPATMSLITRCRTHRDSHLSGISCSNSINTQRITSNSKSFTASFSES